jgi:xylose isomerase
MFDRVISVEHVQGVELIGNWNISAKNIDQIKENMARTNLKLVSIIPDHFGQAKWGKGAFSSKDPAIRRDAVEHTKEMMDIAAELGGNLVSLWPGQDGYDYPFQADYIRERDWFAEGVKACCQYRKDVNVSIEYKPKEPRNRSYPSNVSNTLLMIQDVNEENCGVTIDYGHALVAYENPAESVALLKKYGNKLFHIHMNDNYGYWDDDMIAGSIHTIPYLEFFYWLRETDYQGWISTDQYPYREDGRNAVNESVQWMVAFHRILERMDDSRIKDILKSGDATQANKMLRECMFGL